MSINLNKKSEGIDYELIPSDEHEQAWNIRILDGNHPETILKYGAIGFNKVKDCMTFNFTVISSPDPDLTSENESLQIEAGEILEDIIATGIEDGSVLLKEPEDG
jgi:hypothetical protein